MTQVMLWVPSAAEVNAVCVGSMLPNTFGNVSEVVEISYRGTDVKGRPYVGFYSRFSENATMSDSIKAGELVRSVQTSRYFKSAELDTIERSMNANSERVRFVEAQP